MNTSDTQNVLSSFPPSTLPVEYAWMEKGAAPGPTVTLLGGVHGNEMVGVDLVKALLADIDAGNVASGTLKLALGNTQAILANTRKVLGDKDLNRCFGDAKGVTDTWKRATNIKTVIDGSDLLLDVHSTINPSDPFIGGLTIDHPMAKKILPKLGIKKLITGPGWGTPSGETLYADTYGASIGAFALTIEAGSIKDPQTSLIVSRVRAMLKDLGVLSDEIVIDDTVPEIHEFEHYYAYKNIIPDEGFEFVKPFANFEFLPAGTVYATCGDQIFTTDRDSQMIFAKSKANMVIGEEAGVLVEPARIITL